MAFSDGGASGGGGTGIYPDGTHIYIVDQTVNQLSEWATYADNWAAAAQTSLEGISDAAADALTAATLADRFIPTLSGYSITDPDSLTLPTIGTVTAVDTGTAPTISIDTADAPSALSLESITVPSLSSLSLPTFVSDVPAIALDTLVADYVYSEGSYEELVKTTAISQISSVLGGEKIVSDAIWDGIYDRKKGEAARVKVETEWAAQNYAASLGMTGMHSEALASRLQRATDEYNRAVSAVGIEQATQEAIQRREDMWRGLEQALAWETMWIGHYEAVAGRALAAAGKAHDALIATYNANIARYNLLLAAVSQEVEAKRLELDIALAPLQEFQASLNKTGQELAVQDLNLRKWLGDWEGWRTEKGIEITAGNQLISLYNAEWQADQARHSGDIAAEGLVVSDIQQKLRKFEIDWDGINKKAQFWLEDDKTMLDKAWKEYQTYLQEFEARLRLSLGVTKDLASYQVGALQGYLQAANFSIGASAPSQVSYSYSGDA